jgi:putative membrane protein
MREKLYSRFEKDELILRDELAIDRTLLANERTLLAYLRSAVSLLIAGVSIMHFSQQGWFWLVGMVCIPTGVISGIIGVAHYRTMNQAINHVRKTTAIGAIPVGERTQNADAPAARKPSAG